MQTKFTYAFYENELDESGEYFDTFAQAVSAAEEEYADDCYGDILIGHNNGTAYVSEINIRNNDENEIIETKAVAVSCTVPTPRSDRDEHFWQGNYL